MAAVSQWEREAIGERTRDALRHKRTQGRRVGNIAFGSRLAADGEHLGADPAEQSALTEIRRLRGKRPTFRRASSTWTGPGLSGRSRAAETGRDGTSPLPRASVQVPEQHD